MARALLIAMGLGACSPALEPGFFRCDTMRGCPDDWFCHGDGFCYPAPETFVDSGRRDAGAREDGALPDGEVPVDAGAFDADFDAGDFDAGPEPAVDAGCGRAEDCNDGFDCTIDDCLDGACTATPAPDRCFIDGVCYDIGDRDPGNECLGCYGGTDEWVARTGADCNADPCRHPERCTPEGNCVGAAVADGTVCEGSPETSICCDGGCRDTLGDSLHCGGCYTACRGASCSGGYCMCSGVSDTCPADAWECTGSGCRCVSNLDCEPFFGQRCDNATGRCVFP